MYTVQPQTVVILVLLGAVSPRKYRDLCWDFKPSQTKSSSNVMTRVIPSLSLPTRIPQSDSHNPAILLYTRGAWKQALKTSSAFLSSHRRVILTFCSWPQTQLATCMEMQIDPGFASPESLLGNGHFMLGLLEEYYFVRSIQMASVSVIVLWVLCPFSWTAPPAVLVFGGQR